MFFGKYIKKENIIREIAMSLASYGHRLKKLDESDNNIDVSERLMLIGRIDALSGLTRDLEIEHEVERWRKIYLSRLMGFGRLG